VATDYHLERDDRTSRAVAPTLGNLSLAPERDSYPNRSDNLDEKYLNLSDPQTSLVNRGIKFRQKFANALFYLCLRFGVTFSPREPRDHLGPC
jgi:hypothetical protein